MINRYSPLQPNPRDEAKKTSEVTKPNKPPSNENFRKLRDKRPDKNDEEMAAAVEEPEESPSLFDLSKAAKNKRPGSSSGKSSLKDASSNELRSTPPGTAKQDISEDEGSSAAAPFEEEAEPLAKPLDDLEGMEMQDESSAPPSGPLPLKPQTPPPKIGKPQTPATAASAGSSATPPLTQKKDPQAMDLQKPEPAAAAAAMSAQQKVKGAGEKTSLETGKPGQDFKKQKTDKTDKTKGESRAEAKGDPAAGIINAGVSAASFQTEKLAETQRAHTHHYNPRNCRRNRRSASDFAPRRRDKDDDHLAQSPHFRRGHDYPHDNR